MLLHIRGALVRMAQMFSLLSPDSAMSSSVAIFLAQLMGTNSLASVVLIRSRLPAEHRATVADVLQGIELGFYRRCFDVVFVVGVLVAALSLTHSVLQTRKDEKIAEA
mmetsp:Transcript_13669/g.34835  ORF Transcript_13669/g.34835 Transcript_13669/m.34835 type:complete len:108 (-) Transcript_13669:1243-1566(-)